jgi:hypothetical protein
MLRQISQLLCIGLFCSLCAAGLAAQNNHGDQHESIKTQGPIAQPVQFFRDCTPKWFSARHCAILEEMHSARLRQLGEAPLTIPRDSNIKFLYRFTFVNAAAGITANVATISIMNDSTVRVDAKVAGPDGDVQSSRSFSLSQAQSRELSARLRWQEFISMESFGVPERNPQVGQGVLCILEGMHDERFHATNLSDANLPWLFNLRRYLERVGAW